MKLHSYSIQDRKSGFSMPIPMTSPKRKETDEIARRWFATQMHTDKTMENFPEDFRLYYIGVFDTETGEFENVAAEPTLLEKGENIIAKV